jgi:hypothetical protein
MIRLAALLRFVFSGMGTTLQTVAAVTEVVRGGRSLARLQLPHAQRFGVFAQGMPSL